MLHIGPLKLMSLANYNSQSACFPVTVFVTLNIVALTTTVFLQIWSTSEKNKGREKNKGNISTSVSFTLYLCLKKDWTRPTFSSNTFSAHMLAHTHTHWQSCLLFWALCLLSLLLVSRLCVCQWCCFLPTSGTAASHESAPFSSVFIDRASLCVSQLVPLSLYFPSFWTHIVCANPFFPHSETGISQCTVIPTR